MSDSQTNIPFIIGISGKMHSGKDTVAEIVAKSLTQSETFIANFVTTKQVQSIEKRYFADNLRKIVSIVTGIEPHQLLISDIKKQIAGKFGITYREILQKLGNYVRTLNEDAWSDSLFFDTVFNNHVILGNHVSLNARNIVIIPDVRYKNEIKAIEERGGIVIRVNRAWQLRFPDYNWNHIDSQIRQYLVGETNVTEDDYYKWFVNQLTLDETMAIHQHDSEVDVDNHDFDFVISNNGNLEKLESNVKEILKKIGYIS